MTNEELILKGLREIFKQNKEIITLLQNHDALCTAVHAYQEVLVPPKPGEGHAAKLMRASMGGTKL